MRPFFLTLALIVLAACSGCESSDRYLSRAKNYIAESDYTAAAIELQNTLKLDSKSAEARWLLGKISVETGDIQTAAKELQLAQDLGWIADDIRPAMAKTLLAQGKFADVLKLEYQDLNPSGAALLLSSQAMAAVSNNQPDKAEELMALAQGKAPHLLEVKLAEATIAVHQGNPERALILVDTILESDPDCGEAWRLKGQALGQQGELLEARTAFDQSITHSLNDFPVRIARALVNVQLEDYKAVQANATELLTLSPKDPAANYIQGILHLHNKKYRDAITALTLAIPAAQQFPSVLYSLSISYLLDNELALAEKFAKQFVRRAPEDGKGRKLLAAILVMQGKVKTAQDILQPVLDYDPDDVQALNIMANALLLDDQADIGMLQYARIAQLRPDWRFIPLRLESELVTPGSGVESSQLPATTPDDTVNFPQNDILSILDHLAKKDFPGAIEVATHYHIRDFDSLAPYRVLGKVYFAAGQPADAKEAFENAIQLEPGDPAANLSLAELALQSGDPDAARRYYQTVLRYHPDNLATLMQLTSLEASEKNVEAMLSGLEMAMAAHPTALEPRLRLAGYFMGTGSPEKVAPLFAKLTALQRLSPRALELTALAQLAQKQNDSALATLQQLVNANPASAQAQYLLAVAASEAGDQPKAKQALMEAIKRDPKHVLSLISLARIAKSEGEQGQFEQYLATLVELAPEAPEVLRLRALSAQANGNVAEALVFSQRAFEQAPTTQTVLELSTYQKAAGRNEAAHDTLRQWIKDHPQDVDVRLFLANKLARDKDIAGAHAQYLAVLEQAPGNLTALNNLAWSLRLENSQKALEYIRRAADLMPAQPDLLDTLAVIESINGDHKSAQQNIQRALEARPDDISMRYHEAMITAALGDKAKAISALEELVTKNVSEFPERAEAEALLKKLKG